MKTVILKNGAEEAEVLVGVTMMALSSLIEKDPIAFYELVCVSRDSNHELWANTGDKLAGLALLEANGRPHESVRNVVKSAVEGDGLAMRLVNPLKEAA